MEPAAEVHRRVEAGRCSPPCHLCFNRSRKTLVAGGCGKLMRGGVCCGEGGVVGAGPAAAREAGSGRGRGGAGRRRGRRGRGRAG
jgi:hypothetical protein